MTFYVHLSSEPADSDFWPQTILNHNYTLKCHNSKKHDATQCSAMLCTVLITGHVKAFSFSLPQFVSHRAIPVHMYKTSTKSTALETIVFLYKYIFLTG